MGFRQGWEKILIAGLWLIGTRCSMHDAFVHWSSWLTGSLFFLLVSAVSQRAASEVHLSPHRSSDYVLILMHMWDTSHLRLCQRLLPRSVTCSDRTSCKAEVCHWFASVTWGLGILVEWKTLRNWCVYTKGNSLTHTSSCDDIVTQGSSSRYVNSWIWARAC